MSKGLIRITVFSVFLWLLQYALAQVVSPGIVHQSIVWILVFFWVTNMVIHILSHLAHEQLEMDMTLVLLAGVTGRLLIAIAAMVTVAVLGVADRSLFIINFAVVYLCYLVFEISSVLSNLRSNLK
ncbi:hypothetical protein BFP72_18730 [Reichenbachiella sp. 5M10]|uniref:hypothetical protein n=1 Tax=Reichenbachiella sp. 5M10 TaxID=1889772 RepID=UPI000C1531DB|nr:hypothetical protein [Reichenbachiella sp. 5M10]PIB37300.1 hypothetical protein BFP72_18730 [Reichenbachiella sp. 5M10]